MRTHVTIHSTTHTITVLRECVTLLSDDVKKQRAVVRLRREFPTIHPLTLAEYNRLQTELTGLSDAGE